MTGLLEDIQARKVQIENLLLLCPIYELADDKTRLTIRELKIEMFVLSDYESRVKLYEETYKVQLKSEKILKCDDSLNCTYNGYSFMCSDEHKAQFSNCPGRIYIKTEDVGKNTAKVSEIPECSFCDILGRIPEPAVYDAKSRLSGGIWGYMCEGCFKLFAVGLGLGKGQKLVLIE